MIKKVCCTCRELGCDHCHAVDGQGCDQWMVMPTFELGRRAGIEEAIEVIGDLNTESPHTVGKCIVELRRVLEAQ